MAAQALTKSGVDEMAPGTILRDDDVAGFGIRCVKAAKVYFVQYRFGHGRRGRLRWYSIGRHGAVWKDGFPLTLEKARREARRLLGLVQNGRDPAQSRDDEKAAITVADLCDRYLKAAPSLLTKYERPKSEASLAIDAGRIVRHIKPLLGRMRIDAVTRRDVEQFQADVTEGKTKADVKTAKRGRAIVRGGAGTAARTMGLLGGIFTYAVSKGWRTDNPVRGVRRQRDRKMQRYLNAEEFGRLGAALAAVDREKAEAAAKAKAKGRRQAVAIDPATAAIRLLIFTGARKSEILTLQWTHVDFDHACLNLPVSKTGAKQIYLPAPALAVLKALPKRDGNPYVFAGEKDGHHFVGLPRAWERVREAAKLADVRLHDLRHSYASLAAAGGANLLMISKLLGHADMKTAARYTHIAEDPVRQAAERVAKRAQEAMASGKTRRSRKVKLVKLGAA